MLAVSRVCLACNMFIALIGFYSACVHLKSSQGHSICCFQQKVKRGSIMPIYTENKALNLLSYCIIIYSKVYIIIIIIAAIIIINLMCICLSYLYLLYLMCICCTLCVFVVPYVYLLYLMCICCTLCVFVVSYVYLLYLMCICCTMYVLLFLL